MAEAIILVGLQGAGKTTYFMNHFASTHVHISRDIQSDADLMQQCFNSGRSFVLDNTNVTRAARAP